MSHWAIKWCAALSLSLGAHVALAALSGSPQIPLTEGGAPSEIVVRGNSFEDHALSGKPAPVEEFISPSPVTPNITGSIPPDTPPIRSIQPTLLSPAALSAPALQPSSNTASLLPLPLNQIAPRSDADIAASAPVPEVRPIQPQAKPALTQTRIAAIQPQALTPQKPAKLEAKKNSNKKPKAKRPRKKRSGANGKSDHNARQGAASGKRKGTSTNTQNAQRQASAAGNAAVSNYPGKVTSKLRRALRYPRAARSKRLQAQVTVSFTVNRNGGVSNIRIARGSGFAILDKAAMDTVRRAAPFPAIPAESGRKSWPFSVSLLFKR